MHAHLCRHRGPDDDERNRNGPGREERADQKRDVVAAEKAGRDRMPGSVVGPPVRCVRKTETSCL